ncbi:MAG: hypothetical protein WCJ30_16745, partial [Deltaproteobacteria bacterium]
MPIPDRHAIARTSVIARQCVAAICLRRFCARYAIRHPDIDAFIDTLGPKTFQALSNGIGIGGVRELHRVVAPERSVAVKSVVAFATPQPDVHVSQPV